MKGSFDPQVENHWFKATESEGSNVLRENTEMVESVSKGLSQSGLREEIGKAQAGPQ